MRWLVNSAQLTFETRRCRSYCCGLEGQQNRVHIAQALDSSQLETEPQHNGTPCSRLLFNLTGHPNAKGWKKAGKFWFMHTCQISWLNMQLPLLHCKSHPNFLLIKGVSKLEEHISAGLSNHPQAQITSRRTRLECRHRERKGVTWSPM